MAGKTVWLISAAVLTLSIAGLVAANSGHALAAGGVCPSNETALQSEIPNAGSGGTVTLTNGVKGDMVTGAGGVSLEPLANNGGPTQTMALLPGSPAIDGVPGSSGLCPATDQRGFSRATGSGGTCDIGAFEYQDPQVIAFTGPSQTCVRLRWQPVRRQCHRGCVRKPGDLQR